MANQVEYPSDYSRTGKVQLKKRVFTVVIYTENEPLVLNNEDINKLFFVEDIFKFCMVGTIVFNDRYNFMEFGPFTGNEKIAIIYSVGEAEAERSREMVFDVWKVGRVQQIGTGMREESENLITMHFVDPFFAGYTLKKYSKSWSNEYYHNIMKEILNNMVFFKEGGKRFYVENSTNRTDFIIPYWTPQTAVRWLMRRANGRDSETSGYLCFNNTRGGFSHNLVTMNYLLSDIGRTFDSTTYNFNTAVVSQENKVLEWWISGIDRTSNPTVRGGRWKGYDFSTKKLLDHERVYSESCDETVMLGRKTLYNRIDDAESSNNIVGDSSDDLLENISYSDWAKRYNMQFIVNLVVEGHEKRYAGQLIEIEWPSWIRNLQRKTVPMSDLLKGKYLIKSVTHSFNPGSTYPYRQRLVLIKNAYANVASRILYDAKFSGTGTQVAGANIIIRR